MESIFFKGAGQTLTNAAFKVSNTVANAVDSVGNTISTLGQMIFKFYKDLLNKVEQAALEWVVKKMAPVIKPIIIRWLNNPIIAKIVAFAICASGAIGAIVTGVERIKGIIELIQGVVSGNFLTFAKVIVNLICNWQKIATIVTTFKAAFSEKNILAKYFQIGSAVGQILALLGDLTGWRRRRFAKK